MAGYDPRILVSRLAEVSDALPYEVTTKPMMGGFIGYADGRVFVSLSSGGFGVKLLPDDQERLLARPGAARMRHLPDQPASKTYISLGDADVADDDVLIEWLRVAAETAPTSRPKKR